MALNIKHYLKDELGNTLLEFENRTDIPVRPEWLEILFKIFLEHKNKVLYDREIYKRGVPFCYSLHYNAILNEYYITTRKTRRSNIIIKQEVVK